MRILFIKICNDFNKNPKVLQKNAVTYFVRIITGVLSMYCMLPGCYNFNDSAEIIVKYLKEACNNLVYKFYRLESGFSF